MNKAIKQIIPLPASGESFLMASETGTYNESYKVVACALLESGLLLPVLWNQRFKFVLFDPARELALNIFEKALDNMEKEGELNV